jgi:hypothetical protein
VSLRLWEEPGRRRPPLCRWMDGARGTQGGDLFRLLFLLRCSRVRVGGLGWFSFHIVWQIGVHAESSGGAGIFPPRQLSPSPSPYTSNAQVIVLALTSLFSILAFLFQI